MLSRQIAELGIYPAVDPLDSTSRMLDPRVIGDEHYETARATQKLLQDYKGLQVGRGRMSQTGEMTLTPQPIACLVEGAVRGLPTSCLPHTWF